ncbi:hypothetical protein 1 [Hubei rhabdo-like virus 2]|uniref:hypothetical protein 1 n=1 Tax=Hubei rhabdo-like virus 2 TaxID=1923186 RepID=UPI00090AEA3A|nr:hypothetical protein 1 [Hubei rhabdo-like virus 2]APG78807.1 hypothetical protein 1 [Hubei rhabdo-like virus 2]
MYSYGMEKIIEKGPLGRETSWGTFALETARLPASLWHDSQLETIKMPEILNYGVPLEPEQSIMALEMLLNPTPPKILLDNVGLLLAELAVRACRVPLKMQEMLFCEEIHRQAPYKHLVDSPCQLDWNRLLRLPPVTPKAATQQASGGQVAEADPQPSAARPVELDESIKYSGHIELSPNAADVVQILREELKGPLGVPVLVGAYIGYWALCCLRAVSKSEGNITAHMGAKYHDNFKTLYQPEHKLPIIPLTQSFFNNLITHFSARVTAAASIIYECVTAQWYYLNRDKNTQAVGALRSAVTQNASFHGLQMFNFFQRVAELYNLPIYQIVRELWAHPYIPSLIHMLGAHIAYIHKPDERAAVAKEFGFKLTAEELKAPRSIYWSFARYFDSTVLAQLNCRECPELAVTLAMLIDAQESNEESKSRIIGNYRFPPIDDDKIFRCAAVALEFITRSQGQHWRGADDPTFTGASAKAGVDYKGRAIGGLSDESIRQQRIEAIVVKARKFVTTSTTASSNPPPMPPRPLPSVSATLDQSSAPQDATAEQRPSIPSHTQTAGTVQVAPGAMPPGTSHTGEPAAGGAKLPAFAAYLAKKP